MRPTGHFIELASLALALVAAVRPVRGDVSADQPAAMLVYPYVAVDSAEGGDSLLQISNTSTTPVVVRCFYESAVRDPFGLADLKMLDFQFQLTPRQPIAWRASQGLAAFPLDGVNHVGSAGIFNENSQIPPVPSDPSVGFLRCIAMDRNLVPVERNVLIGTATIAEPHSSDNSSTDVAQYRAIGIPARIGAGNGDDALVLGGPNAEYDGCPLTNVIPHFFDGALEPAARTSSISTTLVLIPCSDDLAQQVPGEAAVTYEVFNEFEQRFGTSHHLQFQQVSALSAIGGANPDRSIFNVQVAGTLTGQSRIQAVSGSGILALAIETHRDLSDPTRIRRAAFNAHRLGTRDQMDTFVVPPSTLPPTIAATHTATATATPRVPTPTATATATATSTRTATPTGTPSVTPPAPSPTRTAPNSSGGCAVALQQQLDSTTACTLLLGPALALLRRRRARRE